MTAKGWGSNLHEWRRKRGYTLAQLASLSGLDGRLLWQLENGIRKGTPNQWLTLARTLDVEIFELVSEPRTKPEDPGRLEEKVSPYQTLIG